MAAEMNYQQNTFASNLRSNRSNTIGVILPRFESSFLSAVVSSIEKVVRSKGYNLLVSQSYDSNKLEKENLLTHFNNRVEGLLINLTPETNDLSHLDLFLKKGIPVVLFDRVRSQQGCLCTTVTIDNKQAGYDVTNHLFPRDVNVSFMLARILPVQYLVSVQMATGRPWPNTGSMPTRS